MSNSKLSDQFPAAPPGAQGAERILAAAEALFAEQGYDAVSINAIADRAGVSKANVFHHYSSKRALYIAVLQAACRQFALLFECLDTDGGTGGAADGLRNFTRGHLRQVLDQGRLIRLVLRDLLDHGPEHGRELAEQVFGGNFSRLVGALRDGQARGDLRAEVDPAVAAALLIGADLFFFQTREVLRHFADVDFADAPETYSDKLADLLLNGMRAASAPTAGRGRT